METITYSSEAEGITEKPATNPETGLTDAQAVQKLLDVHYRNIEIIKDLNDVVENLDAERQFLRDFVVDQLIDRIEYMWEASMTDDSLARILSMPDKQITEALQLSDLTDWPESVGLEKAEAW